MRAKYGFGAVCFLTALTVLLVGCHVAQKPAATPPLPLPPPVLPPGRTKSNDTGEPPVRTR